MGTSTFGELEAEGLVKALTTFAPWIYFKRISIYSDNQGVFSLSNFKNCSRFVKRRLNDVQWFNPRIRFVPGHANLLADYLSRFGVRRDCEDSDKRVQSVKTECQSREEALASAHRGHFGWEKTLDNLVTQGDGWPGCKTDVIRYVTSCKACQACDMRKRFHEVLGSEDATSIGEVIGIDFIGPLKKGRFGVKWIFTVVDAVSRWPYVRTCKARSAIFAVHCLQEWVERMGNPRVIIGDRDSCFTGKVMRRFANSLGIRMRLSPPYSHKSNGLNERMNKTFTSTVRKLVYHRGGSWSDHVATAIDEMRRTRHDSTSFSPLELVEGKRRDGSSIDEEVRKNMIRVAIDLTRQTQRQANKRWQRKINEGPLVKDSLVWIFDSVRYEALDRKFDPFWFGPGKISKQLSKNTYEVISPNGRKLKCVHGDNLKKFY